MDALQIIAEIYTVRYSLKDSIFFVHVAKARASAVLDCNGLSGHFLKFYVV